ncbi:MAG: response regulator [Nitrospinae bacterium]|nr:response regulator [Nitrospinota bacterium]
MNEFDNGQLSGMSVLIVDDTPENINILGHIMARGDLNVSVAPNGEKALELIGKNKPDLILLDVMMPGIDGYEVCKKLKQDEATKEIPIIFLTALSGLENIVKGFKAGGADYITKPFHEEEVICRVTSQLQLQKTRNELIQSQKNLAQSEKLYRTIVEKVPEYIFQLDPDRNLVFANQAFSELGYKPEELKGKPLVELIASDNKDALVEEIATRYVGPLAPIDITVELEVNMDSTVYEVMQTSKILVSSVGIWNVSDEEVFKNKIDKEFQGTLCVGKI